MSFLLCLLLVADTRAAEPDPFAQSTQMIVVTTSDWKAVDGRLVRYERTTPHELWRTVGEPIPIVVGKNGLGWGIGVIATDAPRVRAASDPVKKEGDGKAPAGVFALGTAFGYAPQALRGSKMPYLNLTPSTECVDDTSSKYYNRVVDRSAVAADWNSSEKMRSVDLYRWGIVVGHNSMVTPAPGGGSCVFLHIWRGAGQGTAGCTAMPQIELETLLTWLDPMHKPLLIQLPEPEYRRLMHRWKLPALANDRPRGG
jgi:D-alanyl-D-alanine dipeptidase